VAYSRWIIVHCDLSALPVSEGGSLRSGEHCAYRQTDGEEKALRARLERRYIMEICSETLESAGLYEEGTPRRVGVIAYEVVVPISVPSSGQVRVSVFE
jgi:hypothetical protein